MDLGDVLVRHHGEAATGKAFREDAAGVRDQPRPDQDVVGAIVEADGNDGGGGGFGHRASPEASVAAVASRAKWASRARRISSVITSLGRSRDATVTSASA